MRTQKDSSRQGHSLPGDDRGMDWWDRKTTADRGTHKLEMTEGGTDETERQQLTGSLTLWR